jgi:hypothetical protein
MHIHVVSWLMAFAKDDDRSQCDGACTLIGTTIEHPAECPTSAVTEVSTRSSTFDMSSGLNEH